MTKQHRNTTTLRQLTDLLDLDIKLLQWADDWTEGFGATSPGHGEPGRGKNNVSRPVEAAQTGKVEGAGLASECMRLHDRITAVIREVSRLSRDVKRVKPLNVLAAFDLAKSREPRNWGAGECVVCDEWVPGVGEDRLKLGMCPHHYRAFSYARSVGAAIDRHAWIATQRALLVPEAGTEERPA